MANKYSGEKCPVCEELFDDGQDIVVCPDCGTPYHRDCWEQNGECINTSLHESGEFWQPAPKVAITPEPLGEPIRCIRCGSMNDPGKHFCGECGLPLSFVQQGQGGFNNDPLHNADSFNTAQNNGNTGFTPYGADNIGGFVSPNNMIKLTPQSDMDGIKLGDLITYIGNQSLSMIASFVKFAKTGKRITFNLAALFFPHLYFFFRKMYKTGIIYLLMIFLLNIPALIYGGQKGTLFESVLFTTPINVESKGFLSIAEACSTIDIVMRFVAFFYANYWYYKKTREDISRIRSGDILSDEEAVKKISVKGGTSWPGAIIACIFDVVLQLGFLLGMTLMFR